MKSTKRKEKKRGKRRVRKAKVFRQDYMSYLISLRIPLAW